MRARNALDPTLTQRIRAAGCPMPEGWEEDPSPGLTIEVSRREITKVYDTRYGAECVFAVRITNHSYARLEIQRFACHFPWHAKFTLLGPRTGMAEKRAYRLPSGKEFDRERVLNNRRGQSGTINPGQMQEGFLLALSLSRRIPFEYISGSMAPAELSIFDQHGTLHTSEIDVKVDRTATMRPPMLTRPAGQGLYGPAESHPPRGIREQALPSSGGKSRQKLRRHFVGGQEEPGCAAQKVGGPILLQE